MSRQPMFLERMMTAIVLAHPIHHLFNKVAGGIWYSFQVSGIFYEAQAGLKGIQFLLARITIRYMLPDLLIQFGLQASF